MPFLTLWATLSRTSMPVFCVLPYYSNLLVWSRLRNRDSDLRSRNQSRSCDFVESLQPYFVRGCRKQQLCLLPAWYVSNRQQTAFGWFRQQSRWPASRATMRMRVQVKKFYESWSKNRESIINFGSIFTQNFEPWCSFLSIQPPKMQRKFKFSPDYKTELWQMKTKFKIE